MKTSAHYHAMEQSCRRHAELDSTTAVRWLEEAELWSTLVKVEHRLQPTAHHDDFALARPATTGAKNRP
jgi:hypothetical protein